MKCHISLSVPNWPDAVITFDGQRNRFFFFFFFSTKINAYFKTMWAQCWDQYCPLSTHRVFKLWDAGLNTAVYMHYWVSWRERDWLWYREEMCRGKHPPCAVSECSKKKKTLRVSAAACLGHPSWTDTVAEEKKQRLFIIQSDSVLE